MVVRRETRKRSQIFKEIVLQYCIELLKGVRDFTSSSVYGRITRAFHKGLINVGYDLTPSL
jgi:hypothetical protein